MKTRPFVACVLLLFFIALPFAIGQLGPYLSEVRGRMARDGQSDFQLEKQTQRDKLWKQAAQFQRENKLARAAALLRQVVALDRDQLGDSHATTMETYRLLGTVQVLLGEGVEAAKSRQHVVDYCTRQYGDEDWRSREARFRLQEVGPLSTLSAADRELLARAASDEVEALNQYMTGNLPRAIELQNSILKARERILGRERFAQGHPDLALSLNDLGVFYMDTMRYKEARDLFEQARDMFESSTGEEHPKYVETLSNLAYLDDNVGELRKAIAGYERALIIAERMLGQEHETYVTVLNNLATAYYGVGEFAKAKSELSRLLTLVEKMNLTRSRLYIRAINNYSEICGASGENDAMMYYGQMAVDLSAEVLGRQSPDHAGALNQLGMLYYTRGEYGRALSPLEESLAIREALSTETPDYLESLTNVAEVYVQLGRRAEALAMLERVHDLSMRIRDTDVISYLWSSYNLAANYSRSGLINEAISVVDDVEQQVLKSYGMKSYEYVELLRSQAILYSMSDDPAKGIELLEKGVEIARELNPNDAQYVALLKYLTQSLLNVGDVDRALQFMENELAIVRSLVGEHHPDYVNCLNRIAYAHFVSGRSGQAADLAIKASESSLYAFDRQAWKLSEFEMLGSRLSMQQSLSIALSSVDRVPAELVEYWFGYMGFVERNMRQRFEYLRSVKDSTLKAIYDDYFVTRHTIENLMQSLPRTGSHAKRVEIRNRAADLTHRKELLERALGTAFQAAPIETKALYPPLATLARELAAGEVLVVIPKYSRFELDPHVPGPRGQRQTERYVGFVVSADGVPYDVDLGTAASIENTTKAFIEETIAGTSVYQLITGAHGRLLRKSLWEPLEAKFPPGTTHVYVCPDSELEGIPWGALPGKRGETYLIEEYLVSLLSSPMWLIDGTKERGTSAKSRLLLVGGLDYGLRPLESGGGWAKNLLASSPDHMFISLPKTRVEVNDIQRLARQQFGTRIDRFDGDAATPTAVTQALGQAKWAHIATHGSYLPAEPGSSDHLEIPEGSGMILDEQRLYRRNPFAFSSLVLSRANLAGTPIANRDGSFLSGESITTLDLRGLDLAVLSACHTASGEPRQGEGVYGLRRAFHVAGARTVVASLWRIDDAATQELMQRFYVNLWQKNMSKLHALREAQLSMLNQYELTGGATRSLSNASVTVSPTTLRLSAHTKDGRLAPAFWAAFQLSGDID